MQMQSELSCGKATTTTPTTCVQADDDYGQALKRDNP